MLFLNTIVIDKFNLSIQVCECSNGTFFYCEIDLWTDSMYVCFWRNHANQ
jgi:hypothetical protein